MFTRYQVELGNAMVSRSLSTEGGLYFAGTEECLRQAKHSFEIQVRSQVQLGSEDHIEGLNHGRSN